MGEPSPNQPIPETLETQRQDLLDFIDKLRKQHRELSGSQDDETCQQLAEAIELLVVGQEKLDKNRDRIIGKG